MLKFILTVRTLTDNPEPFFPGSSGIGVKWVTIKCRTNGLTILSDLENSDGFRIPEGGSLDIPLAETVAQLQAFNFNMLYVKNTVTGLNAIVEIIGQREA